MYDYNNNPLYNPMINPYLPQPGQGQRIQQQPRMEVIRVNGEPGAQAFPMGPNSSALLLDVSGTIVWAVTTDGAGYKSVAPYDITPHQAAPAPDYGNLEARITKLEEVVANASTVTANAKQSQPGNGQNRPDQAGRR